MPKQRRLQPEMMKDASRILQLKANKKMVQNHFSSITGKVITMKDVHNVAAKAKPKMKNDFQELIQEMKKVNGMHVQDIKVHS